MFSSGENRTLSPRGVRPLLLDDVTFAQLALKHRPYWGVIRMRVRFMKPLGWYAYIYRRIIKGDRINIGRTRVILIVCRYCVS